jgi:pup-ligase protein
MTMVMGGETEYAISARNAKGHVVEQDKLLTCLLAHALRTLKYTSKSTRGRFLRNGGLIYLDAGLHLEWSTPETTSPFDVVRYLKAGDRIVLDLATSFRERALAGGEVFCSRASVDYVSGTLWAAHESFMHNLKPDEVQAQLMPFLASRVIWGAGGWDYRSPGLRFTMSPRAHFIMQAANHDSQHVRPLFHTKNEPLSGTGSRRLHVACSESLCSDTGNVLRFGTTALVLALLQHGLRPGTDVKLVSPVYAVDRFAAGRTLYARAPIASGRRMTAIEIQRHYLSSVEASVRELNLPEWAEQVCTLWRTTLDALEAGPEHVDTTLDWAIKRRLFARQLERRGIPWTSLRTWNRVLGHFAMPLRKARDPFDYRAVLDPSAETRRRMDQLTPVLDRHGLSWTQLPALVAARNEMFEMDAKFGALDGRGIFNALDAAGALRHRVPGADIGDAVERSPQDTRARIRGEVVRRLSEAGVSYGAEWTGVYDWDHGRELDLSNPLEVEERWTETGRVAAALSGRFA